MGRGGVDYNRYLQSYGLNDAMAHKMVTLCCYLIYTFHMPLFMALSGALFKHKSIGFTKAEMSFIEFFLLKFKRLLLPFLLVTIFYVIPIKYAVGYWSDSQNIVRDIILGQIFVMGNNHLWFLPTLFLENLLFFIHWRYFENNLSVKNRWLFLIFLGLLSLASNGLSYYGVLMNVAKYSFWFYLGSCFERYREKMKQVIEKRRLIVSFFIWCTLCIMIELSNYFGELGNVIKPVIKMICAMEGAYMIYLVSYFVSIGSIRISKLETLIMRDSFGIYLYSDTLNYLLLFWFSLIFGISGFTSNLNMIVLAIVRFVFSLAVAVLITEFLRKIHAKYII